MTPVTVDYTMDKLNLSLLRKFTDLKIWELYPTVNETEQSLIIKEMEIRKLRKGKITIKNIMTNPELFLQFIEKKEQDQNSIGNSLKSSTFIEDSLGLYSAVNFKIQKKGTRLAKNGTIKKVLEFMANDDKEGFDAFFNSRARSGTHTIYATDEIETYSAEELHSPSTLDILIDEENEREEAELEALQTLENLENLLDRKLHEAQRKGLFSDEELEIEYVKAGNKFPKKVLRIVKNDEISLFDLMGE